MHALLALTAKDLKLLLRDRAALFLTIAWPLILATFFGAFAPGFGQIHAQTILPVVDRDGSDASRSFAEALAKNGGVQVQQLDGAQAQDRVRHGEFPAYLEIPPGFEDALHGDQPSVTVSFARDPRRKAEAGFLEGLVLREGYAASGVQTTWRLQARDVGHTRLRPPTPFSVTFPQGLLWAVIACAATFGLSLVAERQSGTLKRLLYAPLSKTQILGGKALACFVSILGVQTALLAIGILAFDLRPQSWSLLVLAVFSVAIAFVGIMMMLAVLGRRSQSAAGISWAVLMLFAMLGGGMLPLYLMPPWLRSLAEFSPAAWALTSLEGPIWRGYEAADMLSPIARLLGIGVLAFVIGRWRFRWD